MAKKIKKLLAMCLTISMLMSLLSVSAFAEEVVDPENEESAITQIVQEGGKEYYLASGEEASAENFDVWTSKTIKETGTENEFEITLQVGSTKKAETEDVAIMLVMDVSSSMARDKDGNYYEYYNNIDPVDCAPAKGSKMIDYAKEAAQDFVETLVENADGSEVQVAVVEFANSAKTVLGWTDAAKNLETVNGGISTVDIGFSVGSTDEEVSYWITRKVSYWDEVEVPATKEESFWVNGSYCSDGTHEHDESCREAGYCRFEGCEGTDAAHTHEVEYTEKVNKCLYEDEAGNVCEDATAAHKHDVLDCTYWCDGQGCDDDTPWHTHQRMIYDSDQSNVYYDRDYTFAHTMEDGSVVYGYNRELHRIQSGGTNMEGGLMLARNLVNAGLAEGGAIEGYENVYVILLSDGQPTYYVPDANESAEELALFSGARGGGSWSIWEDVADIVSGGTEGDDAIAEDIKEAAALYAVLYGYDGNQKLGYNSRGAKKADHALTEVTTYEWLTGTGPNYVDVDEIYVAKDVATGLETQFSNIIKKIEILAKAWTVTDELSDEVTFGGFAEDVDYADYKSDDHAITWSLGDMEPEKVDAAGTMEDPYVYTLKYKVTLDADEAAVIEAVAAEEGINTNDSATLHYLLVDENDDLNRMSSEELAAKLKEAAFDHPSVTAFYTDYEFTKMSATTGEVLEGAGFTFFKNGEAWSQEVFSDDDGKVKFENISAGTYELKETTVPSGMQQMTPIAFEVSYGKITMNGGAVPTLIYNATVPSEEEPTAYKIATDEDGDDTYQIEIRVPGIDGITLHDEVILMVDGSYSMDEEWEDMKEAIVAIGEAVLDGDGRTQLTLMSFGISPNVVLEHVKTVDELEASLPELPGGLLYGRSATNCDGAFEGINAYIENHDDKLHEAVVIFLSDGGVNLKAEPTNWPGQADKAKADDAFKEQYAEFANVAAGNAALSPASKAIYTPEELQVIQDTLAATAEGYGIPQWELFLQVVDLENVWLAKYNERKAYSSKSAEYAALTAEIKVLEETMEPMYAAHTPTRTSIQAIINSEFDANNTKGQQWVVQTMKDACAFGKVNETCPVYEMEYAYLNYEAEYDLYLHNTFYTCVLSYWGSQKTNAGPLAAEEAARVAAREEVIDMYVICYGNDYRSGWMTNIEGTQFVQSDSVESLCDVLEEEGVLEGLMITPFNDVVVTDYMSKWVELDPNSICIRDNDRGDNGEIIWTAADGWLIEEAERPTVGDPEKGVPVKVELVPEEDYPAGGNDVFGNTSGTIYKLTWYVKDGAMLRADNYSLLYDITIDTEEPGYEDGYQYPANGFTYLHYKDENGKDQHTPIEVPNVPGTPSILDPDPDPNPPAPPSGGGNGGGGSTPNPEPNPNPNPNPGTIVIPEGDVPLTELPEEDVPLTELPEEDLEDLLDEEVPLAMAPETGDASMIWMALSALSGAGLFLTRKKREED